MGKIISVVNQKGGVGKTTTVVELAHQAAKLGKSILVVDLDAQSNATLMLTGRKHDAGVFDLMVGSPTHTIKSVAVEATTGWPNTIIIPADERLGVIEPHLAPKMNREKILKRLLDSVKEVFDLILIDLPPTINNLTINALVAADCYLIPSDVSDFSKEGIRQVKALADEVMESGNNPNLEFIGIVLTSFQKGGAHAVRALVEELTSEYGSKLLPFRIPDSVKVTESQKRRVPVGELDSECSVALAYKELSTAIMGG